MPDQEGPAPKVIVAVPDGYWDLPEQDRLALALWVTAGQGEIPAHQADVAGTAQNGLKQMAVSGEFSRKLSTCPRCGVAGRAHCSPLCSNLGMAVRRPAWWGYPERCANGHEWAAPDHGELVAV